MATGGMNRLVDHLRRAAIRAGGDGPSDGELLQQFINEQDGVAFETLLRRHAAMVLGVCRRVIGNWHEAEDAFQATFLVLVRKAARVQPQEAVGNWLYGVAYRTALEARTRFLRRRVREAPLPATVYGRADSTNGSHDLRPVLDRELNALPDKYRLPVVLCDLEGRGRKEVAHALGIPEGTLSSRLTSARKTLARRLARRGVTLSIAGLILVLAQNGASACVPSALVLATTRAALFIAAGPAVAAGLLPGPVAALTEGVLKTMFFAKLKLSAVVIAGIAALGLGTGSIWYQARAASADGDKPGHNRLLLVKHNDPPDDNGPQRAREADSKDREQQLRRQIEDARRLAEQARAEAEHARQQAEAEAQRARAAVRQAQAEMKAAMAQARAAARAAQKRKADYARSITKAEQKHKAKIRSDDEDEANNIEEQMKRAQAKMMEKFQQQRQRLQEQLMRLDKQQAEQLQQLHQHLKQMAEKHAARLSRLPEKKSADAGDKLDRILDRLDRMEKRLDRLERQRGN